MSAATIFELTGVLLVVCLLACLAYATSFLLYTFVFESASAASTTWSSAFCVWPPMPSWECIVYQQAKAKREEMRRTENAAERLAQTNRDLREAQASLRRSERLAALGQLTAGLAHELRNPLGTIKAFAEMLTENRRCHAPK